MMQLTLEQIRAITCGAVRVTAENNEFHFYRFTEAQANAYLQANKLDFYAKTAATAGIRLAMRTNSTTLSFDYTLHYGSSREWAYFDILENGVLIAHIGGDHMGKAQNESATGHAQVELSQGEKQIEVYLPWSKAAALSAVTMDDGASLQPMKRSKKMLCFGDSITQGYDCTYPSCAYVVQLSSILGADCCDKGIGGDTFFPPMLAEKEPQTPDYVLISYGTNTWRRQTREVFAQTSSQFLRRVSELYPDATKWVITPIWRADEQMETPFGAPLSQARALLRAECEAIGSFHVIDGEMLTPHLKEFYADEYLHPNDLGFCVYARKLADAISNR